MKDLCSTLRSFTVVKINAINNDMKKKIPHVLSVHARSLKVMAGTYRFFFSFSD